MLFERTALSRKPEKLAETELKPLRSYITTTGLSISLVILRMICEGIVVTFAFDSP